MEKREMVGQIVKHYRREQDLSLRAMAEQLSESPGCEMTAASLSNYELGTVLASYGTFLPMALHYRDWRRDLGLDVVAVLLPEVHQPVSRFAKELLKQVEQEA